MCKGVGLLLSSQTVAAAAPAALTPVTKRGKLAPTAVWISIDCIRPDQAILVTLRSPSLASL